MGESLVKLFCTAIIMCMERVTGMCENEERVFGTYVDEDKIDEYWEKSAHIKSRGKPYVPKPRPVFPLPENVREIVLRGAEDGDRLFVQDIYLPDSTAAYVLYSDYDSAPAHSSVSVLDLRTGAEKAYIRLPICYLCIEPCHDDPEVLFYCFRSYDFGEVYGAYLYGHCKGAAIRRDYSFRCADYDRDVPDKIPYYDKRGSDRDYYNHNCGICDARTGEMIVRGEYTNLCSLDNHIMQFWFTVDADRFVYADYGGWPQGIRGLYIHDRRSGKSTGFPLPRRVIKEDGVEKLVLPGSLGGKIYSHYRLPYSDAVSPRLTDPVTLETEPLGFTVHGKGVTLSRDGGYLSVGRKSRDKITLYDPLSGEALKEYSLPGCVIYADDDVLIMRSRELDSPDAPEALYVINSPAGG